MWTKAFWQDAAERAVKSGCQFALVAWPVSALTAVGDVIPTGTAVALAFLSGAGLSVLTSLASEPFGKKGTASLVGEQTFHV